MNRSILAVVALAGMASVAQAADFMTVSVELSTTGADGSWSSGVTVDPGTSVFARLNIAFNRDAGFDAWGGCTLTQLNVGGSDAGDTADNFAGKLQPSTQTFKLYTATNKIDRLDNVAGSIQLAQLPTGNGGSNANPIVALTFKYNVSANAARSSSDIVIDSTAANMTLATVFTTAGGSSAQIGAAGRSIVGGTIHVNVPTPGALALAGMTGLAGLRRRRA